MDLEEAISECAGEGFATGVEVREGLSGEEHDMLMRLNDLLGLGSSKVETSLSRLTQSASTSRSIPSSSLRPGFAVCTLRQV